MQRWNTNGIFGTPNPLVYHMPTLNPRINVTLSPSIDALVGRLSELQGISKSQLIREMLEAAEPTFRKALAIMAAAHKVRDDTRTEIAESLERSLSLATAGLEHDLHLIASHSRDLVDEAQKVQGRGKSRAKRGASPSLEAKDPPSSNRGVKSPEKGKKTTARGVH